MLQYCFDHLWRALCTSAEVPTPANRDEAHIGGRLDYILLNQAADRICQTAEPWAFDTRPCMMSNAYWSRTIWIHCG